MRERSQNVLERLHNVLDRLHNARDRSHNALDRLHNGLADPNDELARSITKPFDCAVQFLSAGPPDSGGAATFIAPATPTGISRMNRLNPAPGCADVREHL